MGADNIDYIKRIVYEMWIFELGMKKNHSAFSGRVHERN